MILTEEIGVLREKELSCCIFAHYNSTRKNLNLNPGFLGVRPTTKCLSGGTARRALLNKLEF